MKYDDKTYKLLNDIDELDIICSKSIDWFNSFITENENNEELISLYNNREKINSIKETATQKPTIAIWGASQVGKSYLVNSLLKSEDNRFYVLNPKTNEKYDFLKYINPDGGGKQATSIITRFTTDINSNDSFLPIEIELLTPKDLIIIFCDCYFSNFKHKSQKLSEEDVQSFIKNNILNINSSRKQNFIEKSHIHEIRTYLNDNFKHQSSILPILDKANFWNIVLQNINKINPNEWVKVFEILWGKNKDLSRYFGLLILHLWSINFEKKAYIEFGSILRTHGSILDIKVLNQLEKKENYLELQIHSGQQYNVPSGILSALICEIKLPISLEGLKNTKLVEKNDILDFPGIRNRMFLEEEKPVKSDEFADIYKLGKLSCLISKYSENHKIDTLIFCQRPFQTGVLEQSTIIENWININIGKTPEERTLTLKKYNLPPLFFVKTWFNNYLQYDRDMDVNSDYLHKWNYLERSFIDEIGNPNWYKHFQIDDSNEIIQFKNFYFLRDYRYSADTFTGYENENNEIDIRDERKDYINELRISFINHPFIKSWFDNPDKIWKEVATPNKDGSEYIIKNLLANNLQSIKYNKVLGLVTEIKTQIQTSIQKYYHSDNVETPIEKAKKNGIKLKMTFNSLARKSIFSLTSFLECCFLNESELFLLCNQFFREGVKTTNSDENILIYEASPRLSSDNTYEENVEILRQDYNLGSKKETEVFFNNKNIDLKDFFSKTSLSNKSQTDNLINSIENYLYNKKFILSNFKTVVEFGLTEKAIGLLIDNYINTIKRYKIFAIISSEIRKYIDVNSKIEMTDLIVNTIMAIYNNFIKTFGWYYFPSSTKERIINTIKTNAININIPTSDEIFISPEKEELILLYDNVSNMNEIPFSKIYREWIDYMLISFIANSDIPTYDIVANKALGEILDKIKEYDFKI